MKPSCILPRQDRPLALAAAKLLGAGFADVTADLRLIDAADLVAYIRLGQFANIGDLVNSSVELFFKEGTLSFGWSADAQIQWDRQPKISLDMEFRHMSVTVFFNLNLNARHGAVTVRRILFETPANGADIAGNMRALADALADARLPVPRKRRSPLESTSQRRLGIRRDLRSF